MQGPSQTSIAGLTANPSGRRLLDPVRAFQILAMKPVVLRTRQFAITLTCVLTLPSFLHRAAAEIPEGLAEALTTHTCSFPAAKPPIYFHNDGNVIDGDYHLRFTWELDANTGAVHLWEYRPKSKDKARIDLWFSKDLTSFTWYDSRTKASGVGSRADEAASDKTATVAAKEPEKAPPAFDPKTAPSAQLQTFSTAWLDKLTGPLDNAPLPRAQLMQMQTDFQARIWVATPQQKPAYEAARQACVTFGNLMDAREKARTALSNAQAETSTAVRKKTAGKLASQRDDLFVNSGAISSAMSHWQQQLKPWRDAIQQVLVREKQAEFIANNPSDNAVTHK